MAALAILIAALVTLAGCTAAESPTVTPTRPAATSTAASTAAAASGKDLFAGKLCANCHGTNGEGGFGPPLAGTQVTAAQAISKLRTPSGKMPGFSDKQVSGAQETAIIDYVKSLPKPATTGTYRFTAQASDPAGQKLFIDKGCANCHGIPPNVAGTKLTADEEIKQVRTPRDRMGSFTPEQISDADVTTVNGWLRGLPTPTPRATPTTQR